MKDIILYGGTYLNKGGSAITYGTLKAFDHLGIQYKKIIDPEPFFPFDSLSLHPIYRYSDMLCANPISSISPLYLYKPFIKCLSKSLNQEIRENKEITIWHIGDSPFSDSRSALSIIGQVVALESLRRSLGSDVIIGGVSIDMPKTHAGSFLLKKYFKKYLFFARGKYTQKNLLNLGVPSEKIILINDFAYQLSKRKTNESQLISEKILEARRPKIALCLRDFSIGKNKIMYIINIKNLVSILQKDYDVFFVPTSFAYLDSENDYNFAIDALKVDPQKILNIKDLDPCEIIEVFTHFDAIISSRLHGAVLGTLSRVPTIHLYEGTKSIEVLGDLFGSCVPLIKLNEFIKVGGPNSVVECLKNSIKRKDELQYHMDRCINNARLTTNDNIRYIL